MTNKIELGIRCKHLITMKDQKVFDDYFIGIQKNVITHVEKYDSQKHDCEKLIHAKSHIVMPGLINGHTHHPMSLLRGLADDLPFNDWLYKYILPVESKLVNEKYVKAGTWLAAYESILAGVTTSCDMYYFQNKVASVFDDCGLRLLACEAIIDYPAPDNPKGESKQFQILDEMIETYKNHSRIKIGCGPHAPYSCSGDTLKKVKIISEKHGIPIHIHVSETKHEVAESFKLYNKSPVKRLFDLGITSPQSIFAHAVASDKEDIEILNNTKTSVIYNPESNIKLGNGIAPVVDLIKSGVTVGIGTDGAASNNDLSILRECDTGVKIQKLKYENSAVMTAFDILKCATINGAKALKMDHLIGSIEVGKRADIITLSLEHPHMNPKHDLFSILAYSATGQEVDNVICDGKILLENRKTTTCDVSKIKSNVKYYTEQIHKLLEKNNE